MRGGASRKLSGRPTRRPARTSQARSTPGRRLRLGVDGAPGSRSGESWSRPKPRTGVRARLVADLAVADARGSRATGRRRSRRRRAGPPPARGRPRARRRSRRRRRSATRRRAGARSSGSRPGGRRRRTPSRTACPRERPRRRDRWRRWRCRPAGEIHRRFVGAVGPERVLRGEGEVSAGRSRARRSRRRGRCRAGAPGARRVRRRGAPRTAKAEARSTATPASRSHPRKRRDRTDSPHPLGSHAPYGVPGRELCGDEVSARSQTVETWQLSPCFSALSLAQAIKL